jgi:hypothetical protein
MIDQAKKKALIDCIKQRKKSNAHELMLPPELYFDGYDDPHCAICANNSAPVSTARFAARLKEIGLRPEVSGVFVRFYDYDDAESSPDCWIGSDSIYVITTAGVGNVREWFSDFEVTDVWEESDYSNFIGLPRIPEGSRLIAAFWD